jgi:hypothetical protein
MSLKNIDLGLYCAGQEVIVPLDKVTNNGLATITNVEVKVDIPPGVEFLSANVPRGTYDVGLNTWFVGALAPGETLSAEFVFTVLNDCLDRYSFSFAVSTKDGCEDCDDDNQIVVCLSGISCCELKKCNSNIAQNGLFVVPCDDAGYPGDISPQTTPCTVPLAIETYIWSDTSIAKGSIAGAPDSFVYTPDTGFCGVASATYIKLCNGNQIDSGIVYFNVTCGTSTDEDYIGVTDTPYNGDVSNTSVKCINGGITSYHLAGDPTAQGGGLSEPTSNGDVTVTDWDQGTGAVVITPTNGFNGAIEFDYFVRCTDPVTSREYDALPATVRLTIPTPGSGIVINCNYDLVEPSSGSIAIENLANNSVGSPVDICQLVRRDCNHFYNIITIVGNHVAAVTEKTILVDNSGGIIQIDVDPAIFFDGAIVKGQILDIKIIGAIPSGGNLVTVVASTGVIVDATTIGGATPTFTFTNLGESVRLHSDGTNLFVL